MSIPDSFFVSAAVHAKTIKLADGSEHTLHFRELPAMEFRRLSQAEQSPDEATRLDALPRLIAASLVEPDGKPAMTPAQARTLKGGPMAAIYRAIIEVNGGTPEAARAEGND